LTKINKLEAPYFS